MLDTWLLKYIDLVNVVGYIVWVKCQDIGVKKWGAVQTIFRLRLQSPDKTESSR